MSRPTSPLVLPGVAPDLRAELALLREELVALRRENDELRRLVHAPEPRYAAGGAERGAPYAPTPYPASAGFAPAEFEVAGTPPPFPSPFVAVPRGAPSQPPAYRSDAPPGVIPAAFTPPDLGPVSDAGRQQGLDFGAVMQLTPDKLDSLPYGLITLDARGRVIYYNDTESRLVGLPKDRVIGKSFFREVAPCTRIRDFEGRFVDLAANPTEVRVQSFDFVFKFARGEQHVSVVMTPARVRGQFHLALLRRHRGAPTG